MLSKDFVQSASGHGIVPKEKQEYFRGTEYQPFECRKHLNNELFKVQISNGSVFKMVSLWSIPLWTDHLNTRPVQKKTFVIQILLVCLFLCISVINGYTLANFFCTLSLKVLKTKGSCSTDLEKGCKPILFIFD